MSNQNWIFEKHISKKALPGENIISWIKWNPNRSPKKITLKLEADVMITHVLNVDEEALDEEQFTSGRIIIEKEHLQISGFFGFTCFYDSIPESERVLNFIAEFEFDDGSEVVEYSTKIIRPILRFVESDYVVSSVFNSKVSPLDFKLKNIGTGQFTDLRPYSNIVETPDMKIKLETLVEENIDESLVFVKTNKIIIPKIIIEGKGYGMLSLGFEYKDAMGNKYKSPMANVAINIEEIQNLEVPIIENLSKQQKLLLQSSI